MRALITLCVFSVCTALATAGFAEPAPAQPAAPAEGTPAGKIHIATQTPPPPVQRSYKVHDGFYARGSVGLGWTWASFDDKTGDSDESGNGPTFVGDVMIGGSPSPGMVFGGAVLGHAAYSVDVGGGQTNLTYVLIGPFFDAFPDPKGGWHIGGTAGFAGADLSDAINGVGSSAGFGGAVWAGHDWWVADEWSAGAMLRLSGLFTNGEANGMELAPSGVALSLLVTALYH